MLVLSLPAQTIAMPDLTLEQRALAGDRAAWEQLVAQHSHRVVVALLARGLRIDRAREFAQAAWARLFERQQAGELSRLELPGLAITTAHRLALDDARRPSHTDELDPELPDPLPSAEARLVSAQELRSAQTALSQCPPRAQQIFRAAYAREERPHGELANEFGISVQRVRQTLTEVRARLRAAIEGDAHV